MLYNIHCLRLNSALATWLCKRAPMCEITTPQQFYSPFSRTTRVSQCQKRTPGLLWCKGTLTEADPLTIWLGATPSGLTSAYLYHPPVFYRPDALPATQPTASKH